MCVCVRYVCVYVCVCSPTCIPSSSLLIHQKLSASMFLWVSRGSAATSKFSTSSAGTTKNTELTQVTRRSLNAAPYWGCLKKCLSPQMLEQPELPVIKVSDWSHHSEKMEVEKGNGNRGRCDIGQHEAGEHDSSVMLINYFWTRHWYNLLYCRALWQEL